MMGLFSFVTQSVKPWVCRGYLRSVNKGESGVRQRYSRTSESDATDNKSYNTSNNNPVRGTDRMYETHRYEGLSTRMLRSESFWCFQKYLQSHELKSC